MRAIYFFITAGFLAACAAIPTVAPTPTIISVPQMLDAEKNLYAPKPGDDLLNREDVILTSINLSERPDLNPARVEVDFLGSMPGVCNELRLQVKPPDEQYRIYITAYSVSDSKKKCDNVFQQFETNILLGVYSPGKYSVWVNDLFIGDFVSL